MTSKNKLRMRDDLHAMIKNAAKKRGVSMNEEICIRLYDSFRADLGRRLIEALENCEDELILVRHIIDPEKARQQDADADRIDRTIANGNVRIVQQW